MTADVKSALAFIAGAVLYQYAGPWWAIGLIAVLVADSKRHKPTNL